MISDQQYLIWNKKLMEKTFFSNFFIFWGIYITGPLSITAVILLFSRTGRIAETEALLAFVLGRFVIDEIIYFFYKKPRPCQKLNFNPPTSKIFISWVNQRFDAFPSGHATTIFALSFVILKFFPLLGLAGIILAILNGWARLVLGYHYISDILAGAVVGLVSAYIAVYWLAPILIK